MATDTSGTWHNVTVDNGGTLAVNVDGQDQWHSTDVTRLLAQATFDSGSALGFDTTNASGGSFTYGGDIGGGVGVTKLGDGTLQLTGDVADAGQMLTEEGTLLVGVMPSVFVPFDTTVYTDRPDAIRVIDPDSLDSIEDDPDGPHGNCSVVSNIPSLEGMLTIDSSGSTRGALEWMPNEDCQPGTYSVTVTYTYNNGGVEMKAFTLDVISEDLPPLLKDSMSCVLDAGVYRDTTTPVYTYPFIAYDREGGVTFSLESVPGALTLPAGAEHQSDNGGLLLSIQCRRH